MINREGFWWSKYEPHLPMPAASDVKWKGRKDFLKAMHYVEQAVTSGNLDGRQTFMKGHSRCRVCEQSNGSSEFKVTFMKTTWVWPNGYIHYILKHNVRPSLAFQDFILAIAAAKATLK